MLEGPWEESTASSDSRRIITASEWDADAMLILMRIIHGRIRHVPRSISLEMLAKIAVLVDYYDCHEVVVLWSECWIENLSHELPDTNCRNLILWISMDSHLLGIFPRDPIQDTYEGCCGTKRGTTSNIEPPDSTRDNW
jgi:hypothetical protein